MRDLITKAEACDQLRIEYTADSAGDYFTSDDDRWLTTWISVVSAAVAAWLKDEWRLYEPLIDSSGDVVEDSAGDPVPTETLHACVKGAALIELERQYRYRGGESEADVPSEHGHGYTLGKGATALLSPLRKSTVA